MRTLSNIYYSHKNWLEDEKRPHIQKERVISDEMYKEAERYVIKLTSFKDNWKNILKDDVSALNPYTRLMRTLYYCIEKPLEYYINTSYYTNEDGLSDEEYEYLMHIELVEEFLDCVQQAIIRFFGEDVNLIEPMKQRELEFERLEYSNNEPPADTSTIETPDIMEHTPNLTPAPATANNGKQEKGKGGKKPSKDFKEYFLPGTDADSLLPILHEFMDGKAGKELAKYIVAITNVWIAEPGHKSVCDEFKASESAYKNAIDKHYCRNQYSGVRKNKIGKAFLEDELKAICNNIKNRIEKLKGDTPTS